MKWKASAHGGAGVTERVVGHNLRACGHNLVRLQ